MDKKSFLDTILQKRYRQKHFFRIMKISTFLLFVFILCANAENSNSQNINVTIKSNQIQLEKVLNEVERQTGFLFVYNNHVWIFFNEALSATKARRMGNMILTEAMNKDGRVSFKSYDRIFPNQDRLPEGGFGNLIALPMQGRARKGGNSIFVNEDFIPLDDQWTYLETIEKVSEKQVDELLTLHEQIPELGELSTSSEAKPWELPVSPQLSTEDFPKRMALSKSNALYIPLKELSAKALNHIKRIASFKNPEFYARQGMRLSTYNVPRIISCADIWEDYIALPRGCEDAVTGLLENKQICYRIEDETNHEPKS